MLVITQHFGAFATGVPGVYTTGGPSSRGATGVCSVTGGFSIVGVCWALGVVGVRSVTGVGSGVRSADGVISTLGPSETLIGGASASCDSVAASIWNEPGSL